MSRDRNLNEGPVWRALIATSAPMTLGILGVLSVGIADAFFLARSSEAALAAIAFIFPVITTLTSLSIGLAAGTNTVVSQAIGEGESDAGRYRMTLHAMALAALLSTAAALVFYLIAPGFFALMGAKDKVLQEAISYVPYWCLGFPFLVTGMSLNAVFRAAGRAEVAATVMVIQSVMNVVLDPIFIFGWGIVPEMSTQGAGVATGLARILGFLGLLIYAVKTGAIRLDCNPLRNVMSSFKHIARIGAPASISNAINPAGMAIVTAAVAVVGDAAVAGFGAAGRVQSLVIVPLLALSSGIGPVIGQAWGAQDTTRACKALRVVFLWCLCIGLSLSALVALFANPIANVMTNGDSAADYAALYLRIAGWGFFAYGIVITANAAMNARDKALYSMGVSVFRVFALTVPFVWVGVWTAGYTGVLLGVLSANILGAFCAIVVCRLVGLNAVDWAPFRRVAGWIDWRGPASAN
ncbi:MATE family efflux transporter [Roseovarius aestuariivivens]|uniref:MATE family efflux transporter n=1 Tax=Roseovarius aestuariivivens TaxID=1888910 RepID=UPI001080311B|nr:MATE family efflux transporter [Roseovarius aestuariivivens]